MRFPARFVSALLFSIAPGAAAETVADAEALRFVRSGETVRTIASAALAASCDAVTINVDDPYYGREKRFRACPLTNVLRLGFGAPEAELAKSDFFLRAKDGYTRPADGSVLLEPGGYVAFADADLPPGRWEPIDRRQIDPGPFYMVWTDEEQRDAHVHPWPYQLVTIEIAPFGMEFPHVVPTGVTPDSPAWQGFALFKAQCFACHSMNGEGGKVGPDLNMPRSIVEYRPTEQIKAYIRDPESFRFTTMPAHRDLTDAQLDALVAYFEAMKTRKHDPRAKATP